MDPGAIQHFHIGFGAVSERVGVDFDKAGTVDEHFGSHVAHGDQLGAVLEPAVVLFQRFDEVVTLTRAETADKLYEGGSMRNGHTVIYVHTHLIDSVNELQVQCI